MQEYIPGLKHIGRGSCYKPLLQAAKLNKIRELVVLKKLIIEF